MADTKQTEPIGLLKMEKKKPKTIEGNYIPYTR